MGKLKLLNDNQGHCKITLLFNRSALLPVILLEPPQLVKGRVVSWSFAGIKPLEIRQQEHKHPSGSWFLGSWRGIEAYLILEVFFLIILQQQRPKIRIQWDIVTAELHCHHLKTHLKAYFSFPCSLLCCLTHIYFLHFPLYKAFSILYANSRFKQS